MAGFNKIIITGNLTRDPETKQVGEQSVCKFSIASNRYNSKSNDQKSEDVCFVEVDVWGKQAEACKNFLSKGKSVLVEGRLKFNSWKDQEGNMKSKHTIAAENIIFLNSGQQAQSPESSSNNFSNQDVSSRKSPRGNLEDLPF